MSYNQGMSLFSKNNSELVLVLDIGSESVGGAFILKEFGRIPIILNSVRESFRLKSKIDLGRLRSEMLASLDLVCQKLLREVGGRPKKIFCILSTPWAYGQLRTIRHEREKEFRFTEIYAEKLIQDEIASFKKDFDEKSRIIDRRTTKVSLNGYTTEKPHNKKTRAVEIDTFLSLADAEVYADIEDRVHKTFKQKISFTSEMLSDFITVRNIFDVENDFIILNVGGIASEITVMKDDVLVATGTFAYGYTQIIYDLSRLMNKDVYEIKSLLAIYAEGHLGSALKKYIEKNLSVCVEAWRKHLKETLAEILPNRHIPANIFIETFGDMEGWLKKAIEKKHFPEFTTLHNNFNVILATNRILHPFCDFTENVRRDSSLTMKTIFINQL